LSRCLGETDTDSTAYKNLRSLITTAKLTYSEELDAARNRARWEEEQRAKLRDRARLMTNQTSLKSAREIGRERVKRDRQRDVFDVYKLIENNPGTYKADVLPRYEYRALKDGGFLSHNLFGRIKIRKIFRGLTEQDMPNERRYP
jgi:hypothetical protein